MSPTPCDDAGDGAFVAVVGETLRDGVHALRNPLAAVSSGVELLLRGGHGPDDVRVLEGALRSGLERVESLLGQLDELAQVCRAPRVALSVDDLCADVVARLGEGVVCEGSSDATVTADPEALGEALETLVALCLRDAVSVTLSVSQEAAWVTWSVQAEPADGASLPVWGTRVFRVDAGGPRGREMALARARWVVAAHGGAVTLGASPRVLVRLPRG